MLLFIFAHTEPQDTCFSFPNRIYENGAILVFGIHNSNLTAGRMEICDGGELKAVCDDGWDRDDALEVCQTLGFTESKPVSL